MSATVERGSGRPDKGYLASDSEKVPSVTQITGRFKDSGALIGAANKVGRAGFTLAEAWYGAKHAGSYAHKLIEAELNWSEPPEIPEEYQEQAQAAFTSWQEWFDTVRMELVATEIPLVSEVHRFGGTIDCVFRNRKGRLVIGDWKAANGIFPDNVWQIAAYGLLWNECRDEPIGGFHIVRIPKEGGTDYDHKYYGELDDAARLFLLLRAAYDLDKAVAKRAK